MYEKYMGGCVRFFEHNRPFTTQNGDTLPHLTIAYHTYGTLNAAKDNVVWVCHALTANSDCADWWPGMVVEGGLLDPAKYFVVCANKLGSCYGSTSVLNTPNCPPFTPRDNAHAFSLLADWMELPKVRMLIGGSTGGAQALEWAIMEPKRIERLAVLSVSYAATAWIVACTQSQRMAIEAAIDKKEGVATARAISMLQFRGPLPYNLTQTVASVASYQQYQGQKLANRFDHDCYLAMLYTLENHDVGRDHEAAEEALAQITAQTDVIAIDTDLFAPPDSVKQLNDMIPNAHYHLVHSDFGHDGFLIETKAISAILSPILQKNI